MKFEAVLTDTFGGDANYSWVRRFAFEAPVGVSDLALMRRAKKGLDMSGSRGRRETWGETLVFRPYGACVILFVDYVEG